MSVGSTGKIIPRLITSLLFFLVAWIVSPSDKQTAVRPAEPMTAQSAIGVLTERSLPGFEPTYIDARQDDFDVLHYDINLSYDIPRKILNGDVVVRGKSLINRFRYFVLNLHENMTVHSVLMDSIELSFSRQKGTITIILKQPLRKGQEFAVRVRYAGTPKRYDSGSFNFAERKGVPLIYSLNEPTRAPTWFPCKDMPTDKVLSDIAITIPDSLVAVSNGTLREVVRHSNGLITYKWRESYPITTYLMSIAITNYTMFSDTYISTTGDSMPVVYYVYPDHAEKAKEDFKNTVDMIRFFSKTFGEYPFIKEKYGMAEFGWLFGAMEHQTITSFGSALISGKGHADDIIAHELAHQWWGNCVTLATWNDVWLNEGFASYSEALYAEYREGKEAYHSTMEEFRHGFWAGTLYHPQGNLFGSIVYGKGAWVLHMLRGIVSDSIFFPILRTYLQRFAYANASTQDFQNVCEELYGQPLGWFFDQWIKGEGQPRYEYDWRMEKQDTAYQVTLQLKQTQRSTNIFTMPIPVTIRTEKGEQQLTIYNNQREQEFTFTTKQRPTGLALDKDNWVLKKSRITD
jgi:aminopeptidase N